ncbi:MAG TPA: MFS transporter [Ilumatobacter sp.]|nr:MFS transporter [Ilumatobacter sp.]
MNRPDPGADAMPAPRPLWTAQFAVLLLCGLANFTAIGAVSPLVPRYVKDELGASDFMVGLLVAIYAVSAVLVRPGAAGLSNRRGRRVLVVSGAAISGVSLILYAVAPNFIALVPARLLTGVGQALYFTGAATMVAELAPENRRGEAVSYFSVAVYLGTGFGPLLGELLRDAASVATGFVAAGVVGLSAAAIGTRTTETLTPAQRVVGRSRFEFNRAALAPGMVLALGMVANVVFASFMPLYADELGMSGVGLVYAVYAVTIIGVRVLGARLPDVLGPGLAGTLATVIIAIGMALIAVVRSEVTLYIGAVVFAIGISFHYPSLMALVVNRASAEERSGAVASFTAFFDVASGIGGLLVGAVVTFGGYRSAFATAALCAVAGLFLLRTVVLRQPGPTAPSPGSAPIPASGTDERVRGPRLLTIAHVVDRRKRGT